MKPLLAHIYEPHRVTYPCYVQPKLNGIRALYKAGHFQSRDQLPFPDGLLDHLAKPLLEVFGSGVESPVLDGELYHHGWPLQRINAAVTPVRLKPTEDTALVEYHIFDSVDFSKPFSDRRFTFDAQRMFEGRVNLVRTVHCGTEALANELYAQFVSEGYEGMMYRLGDCPYTRPKQPQWTAEWVADARPRSGFLSDKNNRVWHMLKRKDWRDDEFECREVVEGEGKLKGMLGALVCIAKSKPEGIFRINPRFSIGSGLTDSERKHYWENPPIGQLIKVKYLCLSSDGIPLNPTILCINPK